MNPITAAHLHLALCHVPILAIFFGGACLSAARWRASRDLQEAALLMFVFGALLAVPLYLTGASAAGLIRGLPGFSDHLLERHQAASGLALAATVVLGLAAMGSWALSRGRALAGGLQLALLILAVAAGGLGVWTAGIGGQVRHSEIRPYDAQGE